MKLPQVKKRISDFLCKEEGRISKHSLVTMGAFLGSAVIGSLIVKEVQGQQQSSSTPTPQTQKQGICSGNNDTDWVKNCDGAPGGACPINKDAMIGEKAYTDSGVQKWYGNGDCNDDNTPFHFNGSEFAYTGHNLVLKHSHHGSHNSY